MRGLLKTRPAWSQFLVLISITLVSLFIFGLLGASVLGKITGKTLTEVSDFSKWDYSKPETNFLIRGTLIIQFISFFVLPVVICTWLFSTNSKHYLGLKRPSNVAYIAAGIGIMIISIPLINLVGELNRNIQLPSSLERWMKNGEESAAKSINALLAKQTISELLLNIACIAGLAAVGEELLFRGMAQRLLIKMFRSPMTGIVVAAILFSALHMQFYGFAPRLLLGVFLGMAYWYSGSLWVSILGHFVYDALLIVLSYFNPEMLKEGEAVKLSGMAFTAVISAVLVVLIIVWMKMKSTATFEKVYADDTATAKDHPF